MSERSGRESVAAAAQHQYKDEQQVMDGGRAATNPIQFSCVSETAAAGLRARRR
jgi:hypothetical protein